MTGINRGIALAVLVAGVLGVAAGAGATVLKSGPVSAGLVHGCYVTGAASDGTHALTLVDAGTSCPAGDTSVKWAAGPSKLQLATTGNVGFTLAAGQCAPVTIGVSTIQPGDTGFIAPDASSWPATVVMTPLRATTAGRLPVDFCNVGTSSVSATVNVTAYRIPG